ncbi:6-phosphogluconolactonase [bacterium]|nr:6-phosphogluconolactonase [bacterium]
MADIQVVSSNEAFINEAAKHFTAAAQDSIEGGGRFSVSLSGGGTPKPVYAALAEQPYRDLINWEKVDLFWGDERHVPPTDPDSNYRMVNEVLLDRVPIPEENVYRVPAEMEVRMAAFSYEETLRDYFKGDWPLFDFVFLGMGADGHTASLFPHSAGLNEEQRWFIANYAPDRETWRLTLSKNAINAARRILVLVKGEGKAERLKDVLTGPTQPESMPIQLVHPEAGEMRWLVDEAAAQLLPPEMLSQV